METFPYIVVHKKGKENVVADALSRRYLLLTHLQAKILGFSMLKDLYATDEFFKSIFEDCLALGTSGECFSHEGFLYKAGRLCIPSISVQLLLI